MQNNSLWDYPKPWSDLRHLVDLGRESPAKLITVLEEEDPLKVVRTGFGDDM